MLMMQVGCMINIPMCRYGGFAFLEKPENSSTYQIKYRLDAVGNANTIRLCEVIS
jgi:hypothetical protein